LTANLDHLCAALGDVLEAEAECVAEILTALGALLSEDAAQCLTDHLREVFGSRWAAICSVQRPHAIVSVSLYGVSEGLVGFFDLSETTLGILVFLVSIRMKLACKCTIGLLDLFSLGVASDT